MLKIRHYVIIGSVVFITILVANMPARVLFDPLKSNLLLNAPSQLKIGEAKGSVWQGQINLEVSGKFFTAYWDILQSQWFKGRFALAFSVTNQGPSNNFKNTDWIKGNVFGSIFGKVGCFDVNGLVSADLINQFADGQFSLENNVVLNSLDLNFKNNNFEAVKGTVNWPGGLIGFYDPSRGQQQVVLPALKGSISSQKGKLMGNLTLDGSTDVLVSAEIDGKGEAYVAIRKRMLDVLGQSWNKTVDPDDVILEVQQALF